MTRPFKIALISLISSIVGSLAILLMLAGLFANRTWIAVSKETQAVTPLATDSVRDEVSEMRVITAYSSKESCHYPVKAGCLTASGTIATAGRTLACPRNYQFGTKVIIRNSILSLEGVCEDRLAERYNDRIDIWFGDDYEGAVKFGKQEMEVIIIK